MQLELESRQLPVILAHHIRTQHGFQGGVQCGERQVGPDFLDLANAILVWLWSQLALRWRAPL